MVREKAVLILIGAVVSFAVGHTDLAIALLVLAVWADVDAIRLQLDRLEDGDSDD